MPHRGRFLPCKSAFFSLSLHHFLLVFSPRLVHRLCCYQDFPCAVGEMGWQSSRDCSWLCQWLCVEAWAALLTLPLLSFRLWKTARVTAELLKRCENQVSVDKCVRVVVVVVDEAKWLSSLRSTLQTWRELNLSIFINTNMCTLIYLFCCQVSLDLTELNQSCERWKERNKHVCSRLATSCSSYSRAKF